MNEKVISSCCNSEVTFDITCNKWTCIECKEPCEVVRIKERYEDELMDDIGDVNT